MAEEFVPGEIPTDTPIDLDAQPEPEVENAVSDFEEAPAEASTPEPTPEPVPEPEPEPEPEQEAQKVPLGALHEERAKRRELEQQIKAMEDRFQQFQDKITSEDQLLQNPLPEFEDDPAANLDARLRAQEEALRANEEWRKQTEQVSQQTQQLQQFQNDFYAKEQAFAQNTPDYYEAVQYLRNQRAAELESLGYSTEQVGAMVDQEAMSYAVTASQNGVDPVQMFYNVAAQRGYKATPPATPEPDLTQIAALQEQAKAVGTSGQSGSAEVNLADLANMSDEDFDRYTSGSNWSKLWN